MLPYALGEQFTLADIMIYPWLARWVAIETHLKLQRPQNLPRIDEWVKNVEARESVKKTRQSDEYYCKMYSTYFAPAK